MAFNIYDQGIRVYAPLENLLNTREIKKPPEAPKIKTEVQMRQDPNSGKGDYHSGKESKQQSKAQVYKDVAEQLPSKQLHLPAKQFMHDKVITAPAFMDLNTAWQLLQKEDIHYLPVLDEGKLIGVVSDKDILLEAAEVGKLTSRGVDAKFLTLKDLLYRPFLTVELETDVRDIAKVMLAQKIRAMPVLDTQEKLVGLITRSRLLMALANPNLELWG